jgi:nucleotide-binding universal stress UspA family protein
VRPNSEVVVGVDGSAGSAAAVRWAAHLAARNRELLAIVHSSDAYDGVLAQSSVVRAELRAAVRPLVDAAREIAALAEPALPVRSEILLGIPWRQLADLSRHAGLVVVGRSGQNRARTVLLGSTPTRLAARTPCPLAVVPAGAMWPPERVVVAVGAQPEDAELVRYAELTAASLCVPLTAVHVTPDGTPPAELERADTQLLTGRPTAELARFCRPRDLLVIGRRSHRAAVTQEPRYRQLLDVAACPVVLVPLARPTELRDEVSHAVADRADSQPEGALL